MSFGASLQGSFKRGDAVVVLAQREVVDEDEKAERDGRKIRFEFGQMPDVFLCDLYEAELVREEILHHRMDGGGLARTSVAVKEHIGIGQPAHKVFQVIIYLRLFVFIAFEVAERKGGRGAHGDELVFCRPAEFRRRDELAVARTLIEGVEEVGCLFVPIDERRGGLAHIEVGGGKVERTADLRKVADIGAL